MPNFKVKCFRTLHVLLKKEQTNTQVYKLCVCIVNQYQRVKIHTCHAEVTPIYEILINHMLAHTSSECSLQASSCRFAQE